MQPKTRKRLTATVVGASMVLTACGGGDAVSIDTASGGAGASNDAPAETSAPAATNTGSSDTSTAEGDDTAAPATVSTEDALSAADANRDGLSVTDDARTTQVLNIKDGQAATLIDAVNGELPVLLWFFAPH